MTINICKEAEIAIQLLEQFGHEAYIVGGCVRDSLLGVEPSDWDICTSALPEQILECFKDCQTIPTGLKHGTVTVIISDKPFEITTFRIDGEYADSRHPEKVMFTKDVVADLSRRDFTINAMAYNQSTGLIDAFNGEKDLKNKTIRCVGDPDLRFQEDALRMLRALRFASTLGFDIEENTAVAIRRNVCLLDNISVERIKAEFDKLLLGKNVVKVLLKYKDVVSYVIPELSKCIGFDQKSKHHVYDVYEHIVYAVGCYKGNDLSILWALLLHDIGKPCCFSEDERGGHFFGHADDSEEIALNILRRLKFDSHTAIEVLELVKYHANDIPTTTKGVRRLLSKLGEKRVRQLYEVHQADIYAHNPSTIDNLLEKQERFKTLLNQVTSEPQGNCYTRTRLAINGNDLREIGYTEGPVIGTTIQALLNEVMDDTLPNEKEALTNKAKEILKQRKE